jgi:hypothetical protein
VLTNEKQLELLLTRQSDIELFDNAALDFLVFGEAHTYSGSTGAETAVPIRRLRSFCGHSPERTVRVRFAVPWRERGRRGDGDRTVRAGPVGADWDCGSSQARDSDWRSCS